VNGSSALTFHAASGLLIPSKNHILSALKISSFPIWLEPHGRRRALPSSAPWSEGTTRSDCISAPVIVPAEFEGALAQHAERRPQAGACMSKVRISGKL
jgi:hypothetical protein